MRNKPTETWTAERMQYLRDNYKTMAVADIAKHFGDVFTRNAIIGKARRLGLQAEARQYPQRNRKGSEGRITVAKTLISPRERVVPPPPPKVGPVTIMELEPHHCREIIADNPATYCGKQKVDGSSYCGVHHRKNHAYVHNSKVEKHYGV